MSDTKTRTYSCVTSYGNSHTKTVLYPAATYNVDEDKKAFMDFVAECERVDKENDRLRKQL